MSCIEKLQQYHLKVTPQRIEILSVINKVGHINIDDLYGHLIDKFPTLSLATIYKNINTMQQKNLLSEVKIPNQKSVFEITKHTHAHLVCQKCNKIEDIMVETSSIKQDITSKVDFDIEAVSVVVTGYCSKCNL